MALYRYSSWDGSQEIPDFTADDLLESMADDLLRGGDPQRALQRLLRRGFQLPDGRRFEGLHRLTQEMRRYRQDALSRYDPNGVMDRVREQLENILRLERDEIERRGEPSGLDRPGAADSGSRPDGESPRGDAGDEQADEMGRPEPRQTDGGQQVEGQSGPSEASGDSSGGQMSPSAESPSGAASEGDGAGMSGSGQSGGASSAPDEQQFRDMLRRMLERKEQYLDSLPRDNAGRIHGLREYDFLSPEAREEFERLVGGMQRELMEQYFQGLKQGIGSLTPEQMDAIRQMVRDLNEMMEAAAAGDMNAFDRFMEQYRDYFPPGIESLDDLLQHLQRQASAMQSLLDSMDPEQRAELQAMMDELLRDDRLRLDLARLGANLAQMGYAPNPTAYPFRGSESPGFGQSLEMMRRLQAMEDLENALRGGDPLDALSQAGQQDASGLFGPQLGGQIEAVKDMAQALLEAGYLQRDGDALTLTARAIRKLGDASLREIFQRLRADRQGGHTTPRKGMGGDLTQESRPYQFGDSFQVDIKATVMNGVSRVGPGSPVHLHADDFAIYETERSVQHATVLALDMSHSMYLSGLFLEAKKTALALDSLIRGQFPRDALYLIGFADVAFEMTQDQLPGLQENDYVQGTNYEMALSLARRLLARHRGGNRQILFVTDGEPTACTLPSGAVFFNWPPHPFVLESALSEAAQCARDGITINTFLLDPSPRLIAFGEEFTAINRGRMFLTGPYHLGDQVVLDYLQGRSVKKLR
ncbi:MAG TPA: VWA domain-containing protein [Chloroflexota bacterium]|nr:VWA domain-containing protein [Chloroflexota bacterium]